MVKKMKNRKWIILFLSVLLILLTILVKLNLTSSVDSFFYNLITANMNDYITRIFKVITFLGSTKFITFLCVIFLVGFAILKKCQGILISSVMIISTMSNKLVKLLIRRERPEVLKLVVQGGFSYPSGHTMAAVSMYGILIYIVLKSNLNKKLKIILSILLGMIPILVGISRVYLGVHYVTDVLGGGILSSILLLIITYYIDKKKWI